MDELRKGEKAWRGLPERGGWFESLREGLRRVDQSLSIEYVIKKEILETRNLTFKLSGQPCNAVCPVFVYGMLNVQMA